MPTLQTRPPSAAARAVADVPGAITAIRQTNAQAKARELIIIFVNFVFIVDVSFCLSFVVLAFFGSSSLSCHSSRSPKYLAGFGGSLCGKFGSKRGIPVFRVLRQGKRTYHRRDYLGARKATMFSKRSERSRSQSYWIN
jgi:hypothetical protein